MMFLDMDTVQTQMI